MIQHRGRSPMSASRVCVGTPITGRCGTAGPPRADTGSTFRERIYPDRVGGPARAVNAAPRPGPGGGRLTANAGPAHSARIPLTAASTVLRYLVQLLGC